MQMHVNAFLFHSSVILALQWRLTRPCLNHNFAQYQYVVTSPVSGMLLSATFHPLCLSPKERVLQYISPNQHISLQICFYRNMKTTFIYVTHTPKTQSRYPKGSPNEIANEGIAQIAIAPPHPPKRARWAGPNK